MFSTLPDLTPRDPLLMVHLPRRPHPPQQSHHPSTAFNESSTTLDNNSLVPPPPPPNSRHNNKSSSSTNLIIDRSLLGRLKADEDLIRRRQAHIATHGQQWLKPPGLAKTLFQMREERREQEEHAEAVRREMVAQELAEAQAAEEEQGVEEGEEEEGMEVDLDGEIPEGMVDMEEEDLDDEILEGNLDDDDDDDLDDAVPGEDLDDEIPEGDLDDDIPEGGGFGYDGASDDTDEEEGDTEQNINNTFQTAQFDTSGDESSSVDPNDVSLTEVQQQRRTERRELQSRVATVRAQEQRMRDLMAQQSQPRHGNNNSNDDDLYGGNDNDDNHYRDGGANDMLEEEDLVSSRQLEGGVESGDDMDMEADLDDEIPDASGISGVSGGAGFGMDGAGYEHTDSEAELSDDGTQGNVSFARGGGSVRRQQQQQGNFRSSAVGPPPQQQQQNFRNSGGNFRSSGMGRFDPRSSLNHDISGFLSLDGSSMIGSSPHASFRRSRYG
ncbi:hypothetical protein QC761_306980 [Podospora bellae-mahoneyi]|uniref:Uncharacterized protein n=1 Tax=Podospora bellae-mahoneyi TaxID=2093777 RepID=A0ABR0FLW2_9PEZI|nr:hypothetical protein QC761_306980 [Podospora bellae-mahoneyi]